MLSAAQLGAAPLGAGSSPTASKMGNRQHSTAVRPELNDNVEHTPSFVLRTVPAGG
ncbi:hypothetical protein [Rhodococcus aetherivorans]|uniref:hypothetical protein n=1 Tax=Rhodococcus aetherivorans TaxID=191292 RepID=UPI00365948F8